MLLRLVAIMNSLIASCQQSELAAVYGFAYEPITGEVNETSGPPLE